MTITPKLSKIARDPVVAAFLARGERDSGTEPASPFRHASPAQLGGSPVGGRIMATLKELERELLSAWQRRRCCRPRRRTKRPTAFRPRLSRSWSGRAGQDDASCGSSVAPSALPAPMMTTTATISRAN